MLRDSRGKQALHICMSYHVFSVILPLSMHPRCKLGTALRLRALCRSAARPASGVHLRVCWQLMQHTNNEVREHVIRMIGEQRSHNIWNSSCGRADSEVTNAAESRGDGTKGLDEEPPPCAACYDPIRQFAEAELLPDLAAVWSTARLKRWVKFARRQICICCHCGATYRYLWWEAFVLICRHVGALRKYLRCVYARATEQEAKVGAFPPMGGWLRSG